VITIDLRRQKLTLEELLQAAGSDAVRITNKDGDEFILEPANAFDCEATEFRQSAKFMAFLAERLAEPGRTPLADIERRLSQGEAPASD